VAATLSLVLMKWMFYNEGKSAARFCRLVGTGVPDIFGNCYLGKSYKIANNQQPLKLEKKISIDLESVEF
jgi:hypothetical protein